MSWAPLTGTSRSLPTNTLLVRASRWGSVLLWRVTHAVCSVQGCHLVAPQLHDVHVRVQVVYHSRVATVDPCHAAYVDNDNLQSLLCMMMDQPVPTQMAGVHCRAFDAVFNGLHTGQVSGR